jgi:hypothetical protein
MDYKQNDNKIISASTIITEDCLYEMVYDKILNKTSYVKINNFREKEFEINEVKVDGKTYRPYQPTSGFIKKNVVLFPSLPCPYENDEEIINEIKTFIHKYLDVSEAYENIATYYVLFTWLYDKFNEVPYLRALGDYGSGKSRLLQTVGSLCYKPIFTGGATTTSPIFHILDEIQGTLILDEADMRVSDMRTDIIKILNSGYQKGSNVMRMGGKNMDDLKIFNVFGPKIVATRELFNDRALESRFLVEDMGKGTLRRDIPKSTGDSFQKEAELIRNKLLMWRMLNYFSTVEYSDEHIDGVHPRLNQIIAPLISIIKDKQIIENLKDFIVEYDDAIKEDRGLSIESQIVFAILKLEHETLSQVVTTNEITKTLNKLIGENGDHLTPRKVGDYLKNKLQLKTYKTYKGFIFSFNKNRLRLDFWKLRYGITDAGIRGEEVNDVNDVNVVESVLLSNNS